jgi:chromate reductase
VSEPAATSANGGHGPCTFLVFSASLRTESLNTRLALLAARAIEDRGGTVVLGRGDDERVARLEPVAQQLGAGREAALLPVAVVRGALEVAHRKEVDASLPGVLKNALDWVSRSRPQPFNELHGLLLSASPSMVGGNRGPWALRVPFEHLGARI